jgi:fatty acid-binding protein DegV
LSVYDKEYVDTKDLDVKGMAEDLKAFKGRTSTSCPSPNDWIASFEDANVVY